MESIHGNVVALPEPVVEQVSSENKLTLDVSNWSYQDYGDFLSFLRLSDWRSVLPMVMEITVGWTYDLPLGPDAWKKLPFTALPVVAKAVNATLEAYLNGLDASACKTDMDKWDMEQYFAFQEAAKDADLTEYEQLMRVVCRLPGVSKTGRLTFAQGATMAKAITKATNDLFGSGK